MWYVLVQEGGGEIKNRGWGNVYAKKKKKKKIVG
jgi:hypothetical protein